MPELLAALEAFVQEHRRCGELDGGVEDDQVWMACACGAGVAHPIKLALDRTHKADNYGGGMWWSCLRRSCSNSLGWGDIVRRLPMR